MVVVEMYVDVPAFADSCARAIAIADFPIPVGASRKMSSASATLPQMKSRPLACAGRQAGKGKKNLHDMLSDSFCIRTDQGAGVVSSGILALTNATCF